MWHSGSMLHQEQGNLKVQCVEFGLIWKFYISKSLINGHKYIESVCTQYNQNMLTLDKFSVYLLG